MVVSATVVRQQIGQMGRCEKIAHGCVGNVFIFVDFCKNIY